MIARRRQQPVIPQIRVFVDNVSSEGEKKRVAVKAVVGVGKKKGLADVTNSASSMVGGANVTIKTEKKQTRLKGKGAMQESSSHFTNHVAEELDPFDVVHRKASTRAVTIAPCCCVLDIVNSCEHNVDPLYASITSLERDFTWHADLCINNEVSDDYHS